MEVRVDIAWRGDFQELHKRTLADAHDAFLCAGVEAGGDNGQGNRHRDDRHDEERQKGRVADLSPETSKPPVGITIFNGADTGELATSRGRRFEFVLFADVQRLVRSTAV